MIRSERSIYPVIAFITMALASAQSVGATTLTGSFSSDDQLVELTWTTPVATTLAAYTTSYASGGFVPVISLFDQPTGNYITFDGGDASCSNGIIKDPATGMCDDAYLSQRVAAGSYRVVLSEFYNLPNGNFGDGFSEAGAGNFTAGACNASGAFWQVDVNPCIERTGHYSLHVNSATPVPEPVTAWSTSVVLIAGWYLREASRKVARKNRPYML